MSLVESDGMDAPSLADLVLQHPKTPTSVGSKMPTERALEQALGISRHNLRRALALLEREGWISRQVGRGTFVTRSTEHYRPGDFAAQLHSIGVTPSAVGARGHRKGHRSGSEREMSDVGPADVLVARHVIEPNAMKFVVARATTRDFEALSTCLAGGDGAKTYDEFEYWDLELHRAIMGASHNPLLIRLYALIEEARHSPIWGELKRGSSTDERRSSYRCDHHAIVDALVLRDAAGATTAMQLHLTRIEQDLFAPNGYVAPVSRRNRSSPA